MVLCTDCGTENDDDARFCKGCAVPLAGLTAGREQRKTVTAVFCDVVGSTALGESRDPEAVRVVLARYFQRMKGIVEAHGGTVQKFIGDAVVAVFGVPTVHEDDALRALRAAEEMRQALPELGVDARFGVNTGVVVTSSDDTLVTGDAVNVAARLQQAATPGEVLVGAPTLALARGAVRVEKLEPLELKGKAEPVAAYRLLGVGEAPERSHRSRFVGRAEELTLLRAAWESALEKKRCELVTIMGEPGVGKSRLVGEFTASIQARVVSGRSLSYGTGITYFPVVEVVKQLGTRPAAEPAVAAAIASLLGEADAATSSDEIAWAFRKLLEPEGPLLVVFDDIQWGEETFLDLIEHVALFSSGAALLIVCLARPELEERRPRWPVTVRLEPLPRTDVEQLLPEELPVALRERIVRAAGGNPLFVTEMVAIAAEASDEVAVPASLRALLAARVDQLNASERGVLERGAVEGEVFHRGPVQALTGSQVTPQLGSLVRRELIRPDSALLPGEDAFRFCHLLIRDAAYDALPKATRAELHERFADWLGQHGADLVQRDEIIGYHLEQAHRYRTELGEAPDHTRSLAERAAARLEAAGRRATTRGDFHAVVNLVERALELGIADPCERARVKVELGNALVESGRISDAEAVLDDAYATATHLGEKGAAALALVYRWSHLTDPKLDIGQIQRACEQAIETFADLGDDRGLALAERPLGLVLSRQERRTAGAEALERALIHADACGDPAVRRRVIGTLLVGLFAGPTPVPEAIRRCEELLGRTQSDRVLEALLKRFLASFYAMAGRSGEALELVCESSLVLDELNQTTASALYRSVAATARELAGDRAGAEQELLARWSYFGDSGYRGTHLVAIETACKLAFFYCDESRWEDVERFVAFLQSTQMSERGRTALGVAAEARLTARRGQLLAATTLAEDAVALAEPIDRLNDKAAVWFAYAEVHGANGRSEAAEAAVATALGLYEQKGNVAAAARLRASAPDSAGLP
jgi:class 3 adenylate cyclase/predicted ATPase